MSNLMGRLTVRGGLPGDSGCGRRDRSLVARHSGTAWHRSADSPVGSHTVEGQAGANGPSHSAERRNLRGIGPASVETGR